MKIFIARDFQFFVGVFSLGAVRTAAESNCKMPILLPNKTEKQYASIEKSGIKVKVPQFLCCHSVCNVCMYIPSLQSIPFEL